jgi:uncharacterized membrane protein YphA (DoxX/SURF4 family)
MKNFNTQSIMIWILTILLSLVFVAAGTAKLFSVEQVIVSFQLLGMPSMAIVVGLLEIIGAVALFVPKLRFMAALGLLVIMLGAIGYHLTLDPEKNAVPALVLFVLCAILAWFRRP